MKSASRSSTRSAASKLDQQFMREALQLAARARGRTSPNPMVGCVIVQRGKVVARGYHQQAGREHAEVAALKNLRGRSARGATVYVTLEPCDHVGRTGKCTKALIAAGVGRVVCAMRDPNPLVSGRGLRRLARAGIAVECGVLETEASRLNEAYLKWITTRRPFVVVKAAVSLDGRIAAQGGDSRWISGEASRRHAHELRDQSDAILVGAGTVRADDPQLTARIPGGKNPLRVILDGELRTPPNARALPRALVIAHEHASEARARRLRSAGAEVVRLAGAGGKVRADALLDELGRRGVVSLLVEGGSEVIGRMLPVADRLVIFLAPKLLGSSGVPLSAAPGPRKVAQAITLKDVEIVRFGDDVCVTGRLT